MRYDEPATQRHLEGQEPIFEANRGWREAFPDALGRVERAIAGDGMVTLEIISRTPVGTSPSGTARCSSIVTARGSASSRRLRRRRERRAAVRHREGGFDRRHLTFVPLDGITVGPDDLRVAVTKEEVRSAPNIERHGEELSQADESALYHHYAFNYTSPTTQSGRRLARR